MAIMMILTTEVVSALKIKNIKQLRIEQDHCFNFIFENKRHR